MKVKAQATILDGKIAVRTTGDWAEARDACREVGGGRWSKPDKTWRYPLSLDTCHRLRVVFGARLDVGQPLREWYGAQNAKADERLQKAAVGDATLTRLPEVAPVLASALRADQRAAAALLAEGWRGAALLADHPGTGKTICTISGILESGVTGPVLVVCPRLSVRAVWFRELKRWTNESVYMARGTRAQRTKAIKEFMDDPSERKWLIIVAETLRIKERINGEGKKEHDGYEYPELFDPVWSVVAVDESHKMFGSLTVVKGTLAGRGLKCLKIATGNPLNRLAITGTPFGKGGRIQGMFGTLHWLWPDEFTSFWRWAGQHFEIEEKDIGYGRRPVKQIGALKAGADGENFLRTLGPRMIRRTKAEVLPHLPPKHYADVWCEMGPKQSKQYKRLLDEAEIRSEGGIVTVDGVLAAITRGKQAASGYLLVEDEAVKFDPDNSCKIETLFEKLEERGYFDDDSELKVLVASQFNELLAAVETEATRRGLKFFKITGSTSDAKRDVIMEDFQSSQTHTRMIMLNSKAGGVSVTLDAADEIHMLDEMWDPGDNEQLEDRIHRASRIHQAMIFRYRTLGTIDEAIANDVEGRRFEQFKVMDANRGVSYARALLEPKGS